MTEVTSVYFSMIQICKPQIEAKREMHSDRNERIINNSKDSIEDNNKVSIQDPSIKNIVRII